MIGAPSLIKGSAGAPLHFLAKTAPQCFDVPRQHMYLSPAELSLLASGCFERARLTGVRAERRSLTNPYGERWEPTSTPPSVPHLQQSHVKRLFSMSSKYDVSCKSAAQIPGVHYHIFNWLAMSPASGACHEMLNKTWRVLRWQESAALIGQSAHANVRGLKWAWHMLAGWS